jgi:hypothetical protein
VERTSPIKTDLVIGMTLAEIFLLILFVVWYRQGAGQGGDWQKIAEERQQQIAKLNSQLEEQNTQIAELRKIRDFWEENFGVSPPASEPELSAALLNSKGQRFRQDMARGFPRCEDDNLLAEVSVQHGATEVRVKEPVKMIRETTSISMPNPGDLLTDPQPINAFLDSVLRFYDGRASKCRFDYKFTYVTKEDYYDGREKFEKYFYSAGLKGVGPLSP